VLIEQVDIVGTKPAQGAFHRLTDMLTPAVPCRRRPAYCLIALETKPLLALLPSKRNRFGKHTISLLQDIARADRVPELVSWCAPLLITVRVSLTTYTGR
jgi:hypothetical protein